MQDEDATFTVSESDQNSVKAHNLARKTSNTYCSNRNINRAMPRKYFNC